MAKCQGAAKDAEPRESTVSVSACTEVMLNNPAVIAPDETALADVPGDEAFDREPTKLQEVVFKSFFPCRLKHLNF